MQLFALWFAGRLVRAFHCSCPEQTALIDGCFLSWWPGWSGESCKPGKVGSMHRWSCDQSLGLREHLRPCADGAWRGYNVTWTFLLGEKEDIPKLGGHTA